MRVEKELAEVSPEKDMLLTIGVFDGVHLGHKYLISQLKELADELDLLSGVLTFRQNPREVLSPGTSLPYLTNLAEKVDLLKNERVGEVIPLSFTRELADLTTRQFAGLLKKYLRMSCLLVGPDFVLGKDREGNVDALRVLGEDMGFSLVVVSPLKTDDEVVSSTAIRDALAKGDMKRVTSLTGRPFRLQGRVITGAGRGGGLGFPTANLEVESEQALPGDGVYATWAYINDETYQAVTNVGKNPTFDGQVRTVETYVLNYRGNLYGSELKIEVVERLRGEKKFDGVEELKKQMAEDVKEGEAILSSSGRKPG
ncbi:MAG: bifunctional riboflavin kinase/FAD synthetase [Dehalococcoidales bacterium]|jgi:riboflavin kinase/FMN adenylyltransferase|nr:bifunctional riboflavin kinase/FAD synthetase [Dehalococcoidales bacterium]